MTIFMAVTAAFALAASLPHANAVPDLRVIRPAPGAPLPRFVRLRYDLAVGGLRGTNEILVDTATGRYAERSDAGPLSSRDGYDGVRTWAADASGLAQTQEHPEERAAALAWGALIARPPAKPPRAELLASRANERVFRIRYPAGNYAVSVGVDAASGRVARAGFRTAGDVTSFRFSAYARHGDVVVPARMVVVSPFSTAVSRLRSVETPLAVPDGTFVPPPPPNDASLDGIEVVPFRVTPDGITIAARIDGGPPLRMLLDTGASLALTARAARRSGLRLVGYGKTGGIGPSMIPERYATARSVRIGRAEMRNQPLEVFPQCASCDGTIGAELLARFAVRLEFRHDTLALARDAALLRPRGTRLRLALEGGQPEVDGAVDGIRGRITIDTGSLFFVDVLAPAVRAHDLIRRYRATVVENDVGIGGSMRVYRTHVRELDLGGVVQRDLPANLDAATAGAMNDPSIVANAGILSLVRFVTVFDVRGRAMYLQPVR